MTVRDMEQRVDAGEVVIANMTGNSHLEEWFYSPNNKRKDLDEWVFEIHPTHDLYLVRNPRLRGEI